MNRDPNSNQPNSAMPAEQQASPDYEPATVPQPGATTPPQAQTDLAAAASAAEPVQSPYDQAVAAQSKRSPRKGLVLGVVIGLVALLGAGAAAAYTFWYQNPQKVITDAVVNMLDAKSATFDGTMNLTPKGRSSNGLESIAITIDGKNTRSDGMLNAKISVTGDGKTYDLSSSALVDRDFNIYFKLNDVRKTIDGIFDEYVKSLQDSQMQGVKLEDAMSESAIKIVDKIDGNWVRISAEDIEELGGGELKKRQECLSKALDKYRNSQDAQRQIADAYRQNQFIIIKEELGVKDGNVGYVIDGDKDKTKGFVEQIKQTDLYKDVSACDDNFELKPSDIDNASDDSNADGRLELWISQLKHELHQVNATVTDDEVDGKMTLNMRWNEPVTVESPSEFVTFKDLVDDIEAIFNETMGASRPAMPAGAPITPEPRES